MTRRANRDDIAAVAGLWRSVSAVEFAPYIGADKIRNFAESGALREEVEENIDSTCVCEKKGQLVGFVVVLDDLIELLIVAPAYRRGIVAKALYEVALREISACHKAIRAECFADNRTANRLLERLNYLFVENYVDEFGISTNRYTLPLSER